MDFLISLKAQKLKTTIFTLSNEEKIPATLVYLPTHFISNIKLKNNIYFFTLHSFFLNKNSHKNTKSYCQQFHKYNIFPLKMTTTNKIQLNLFNNLLSNKKYTTEFFLKNKFNLIDTNNITINIQGLTIGKGFAGTIKRFNFKKGPKTHGSKSIRRPGSIGAGTTPGRVFKKKKMAGRLGNSLKTLRNVQILSYYGNLVLFRETLPGKTRSYYTIKISNKK